MGRKMLKLLSSIVENDDHRCQYQLTTNEQIVLFCSRLQNKIDSMYSNIEERTVNRWWEFIHRRIECW